MFIKKTHPDSAPESLEVPVCSDFALYDLDNWYFSPPMDNVDASIGQLGRIVAECKLNGYERLKFEWIFTQKDVDQFGYGQQEGFRVYVMDSFSNVLQVKKDDYLRRLGGIILPKK